MQTAEHARLRLDIQGLRALAVILVVAFHLSPKTIPGGYIGVDIFFVISGYLITAHLLREVLRTGSVRLTEFWARRVRRLLPAAFLVLTISAIAVYLILPETARQQNFVEIAFAAVYVLNWRLASDSVDYLATDNVASIAQHYWTLSVEEQFYFVWPILILLVVWAATKTQLVSSRQAVTILLVAVFFASLAFSIFETARSQPSAYFITTTRAWEFAAGGLATLLKLPSWNRIWHISLSWLAFTAIIASASFFNGESPFPGWIALIPVLSTAFLLWGGDSDRQWAPQYLLKFGPAQLVGDTSYAIYLWHWPLIIITTSLLGRSPGWIWGGLIVGLTILLSIATKHLLEDPIRRAPGFLRLRLPTFGMMATGMTAIIAMTLIPVQTARFQTEKDLTAAAEQVENESGCFGAYAILNDCSSPYAITDTVNPASSKADLPDPYILGFTGCTADTKANRVEYRCDPKQTLDHSVMVVGDSQMYSMFSAFGEASKRNEWSLYMRARASCPGFGIAPDGAAPEEAARCAKWSEEVREDILANDDVDTVFFAFRQHRYPDMAAEAELLFSEIRAAGKQVIAVIEIPGAGPAGDAPDCVETSPELVSPCSWKVEQGDTWLNSVADTTGAKLINPWDLLCHDGTCEVVIGGTLVYRDGSHLATTFARTLAPWIQHAIEESDE